MKSAQVFIGYLIVFLFLGILNFSYSYCELPEFNLNRDRILIIPVEFPDCRFDNFTYVTTTFVEKIVDDSNNTEKIRTVQSYFVNVSYGKFNISADFLDFLVLISNIHIDSLKLQIISPQG